MPKRRAKPWEWWVNLDITKNQRQKIDALFTITRDGYTRWYKGAPVFVCGKKTPADEIESRWVAKRNEIDRQEIEPETIDPNSDRTYREVLSEFLAVQKARIGAKRKRIEARTYHNYAKALNDFGSFIANGRKIADMNIREIGPEQFTAYAQKHGDLRSSSFDTIVTLVSPLFRWAIEMEYIDRYRPGPLFVRPDREEIRSDRIELTKRFTAAEVAKLYLAASHTMRCWIALGIAAAFNNADIANVTRTVVDLEAGIIDFRRRKTGKIRRVIPLPRTIVALLKGYKRPEPASPKWDDLFFLTEHGNPYGHIVELDDGYKPRNTVSSMFSELSRDLKIHTDRRGFTGLRTTHYNLLPPSKWIIERKIVMGHAQGTVDLDSYLEDVGIETLSEYVGHIWSPIQHAIKELSTSRQGAKRAAKRFPKSFYASSDSQNPAANNADSESPAQTRKASP